MAEPGSQPSLASGARVLSIGIASTGIFTFAYLATASHVLSPRDYGLVSLCWAIMFVILSVIYRPIEQLLSRTIADRRARGLSGHPLRVPATIQGGFAAVFLVVALALRHVVTHGLFGGSSALYWVLVVGVLAYAGSYFARGWLAGHQRFALYGGLVFLESTSRFAFALAVAVGVAHGMTAVALGMAVAPFASLAVMPLAWRAIRDRPDPGSRPVAPDQVGDRQVGDRNSQTSHSDREPQASHSDLGDELSMRRGTGFAASVVAIMVSEQALMNAGVLVVAASLGARSLNAGLTGFVFNVMLIVRAPLQLFQSVQTSILPHLAGLQARRDAGEFDRAIRVTVLVIAAFGLLVAAGLLAVGPPVMTVVLGDKGFHYDRWGLAAVGLGMGLHLMAGTFNQAALARGDAARAAACWLLCAALFVAFQIAGVIGSRVTRVEVGYAGATALLCLLLAAVYARASPGAQSAPAASASAA